MIKNIVDSIMIDCEEAAFLINKSEYTDIGIKKRMLLGFHLLICHDCKSYYKQSKLISAITSKLKIEDFSMSSNTLCDSKKDEMRAVIEDEMRKKRVKNLLILVRLSYLVRLKKQINH